MSETNNYALGLAADLGGLRDFSAIGSMHAPSRAFVNILRDFETSDLSGDLRPILIYALSSRISGLCRLATDEVATALLHCAFAHVALEWQLAIPGTGTLKGLFSIGRLQAVDYAERIFDMSLKIAGIPALLTFAAETERAG